MAWWGWLLILAAVAVAGVIVGFVFARKGGPKVDEKELQKVNARVNANLKEVTAQQLEQLRAEKQELQRNLQQAELDYRKSLEEIRQEAFNAAQFYNDNPDALDNKLDALLGEPTISSDPRTLKGKH